jgi:hypothetical protein
MKPSHLTTPRTFAECTFVQGYTSHHLSDRPSLFAFIVQAAIGLTLIAGVVASAFGYWQ